MGGNDKPSTTGGKATRLARTPKTAKVAKGKSNAGSKNNIRQARPRWRIKLHDTTTDLDGDADAHISVDQVTQVLKKHLQWVPDYDIDLSIEGGMFTPDELAATGPETRNQVVLCQVATQDKNHAVNYLEHNIASLVDALREVGRLHFNDTGMPRSLADNLKLWDPEIRLLAAPYDSGFTPKNSRVSVVSYFYATHESDEHNRESKAHPGEWESHLCEHEIGHTFLQADPEADADGHTRNMFIVDVMHPANSAWHGNYEWLAHMTPEDVQDNGGMDEVSKRFFALPNAAVLSQQPGLDDIWLLYTGYPGYSDAQKETIAQAIWSTYETYQMDHAASPQKAK